MNLEENLIFCSWSLFTTPVYKIFTTGLYIQQSTIRFCLLFSSLWMSLCHLHIWIAEFYWILNWCWIFLFYHFEEMTQCLLAYIVYVDKSSIYLFWILLYIIHFWLCLFIHLILNVLLALYMQTIYLDNIYYLTTCWWLRKWVKESEANSKTFKLYFLYKNGQTHETGLKSPKKIEIERDR